MVSKSRRLLRLLVALVHPFYRTVRPRVGISLNGTANSHEGCGTPEFDPRSSDLVTWTDVRAKRQWDGTGDRGMSRDVTREMDGREDNGDRRRRDADVDVDDGSAKKDEGL